MFPSFMKKKANRSSVKCIYVCIKSEKLLKGITFKIMKKVISLYYFLDLISEFPDIFLKSFMQFMMLL